MQINQKPHIGMQINLGDLLIREVSEFWAFNEITGSKIISAKYKQASSLSTLQRLKPTGLQNATASNQNGKIDLYPDIAGRFIQVGLVDNPPEAITIPSVGSGLSPSQIRAICGRYYASWPDYYGTLLSVGSNGIVIVNWDGQGLACQCAYTGTIKAGDSIGVYGAGTGGSVLHIYLNGVVVAQNNSAARKFHAPSRIIGNPASTSNCYAYTGTLSYFAICPSLPKSWVPKALHENPYSMFVNNFNGIEPYLPRIQYGSVNRSRG